MPSSSRSLAGRIPNRCLIATVLTLTAVLGASAATPREELLRLVPDDVGFCLAVQDLRRNAKEFLDSPFLDQFRASPLGQIVRDAPETSQLAAFAEHLQKHLNLDWDRLREDILGDAIVFAYRPGPPGQHEKEQGLILIRARSAESLSSFVKSVTRTQNESRRSARIQVRQHNGAEYGAWTGRVSTHFYYVHGPILALTTQEELLRRVIDLDRRSAAEIESVLVKRLRDLRLADEFATLWVNPAAFQPELEHRAGQAGGGEAIVLRAVSRYWKALDGIAFWASLKKKEFVVGAAVVARPEQLPAAARKLFNGDAKPSELWNRFPQDAILAVAGRVDMSVLADMVGEFLTPEVHKAASEALQRSAGAALGKDLRRDVLPCLGPDIGFCITPRANSRDGWFPDLLFALRIQPGNQDKPVDQAIAEILRSSALLGTLAYNNSHTDKMSLKNVVREKVQITYVVNKQRFPAGVEPALALKDGYLIIASSPNVISQFRSVKTPSPPSASTEIPIIRLSLRSLRKFIEQRKEILAPYVAKNENLSKEEAQTLVKKLAANLELFDRIELSHQSSNGQVTLRLRIRTEYAVRK